MKRYHSTTIKCLLFFMFFFATSAVAQSPNGLSLSKNADFSTEDDFYDPSDVLYVKVIATDIEFTDIDKNEFRLKPDDGGNDVEHPLTNNLDGTYTTHVDLATTDVGEDDWEVRVRVRDDSGREFEARVDINVGNEDRDDNDDFDDEVEFTGRVDSLSAGGITVDGIFFIVNDSTIVLDDDNNPIALEVINAGQIVEIRGDRLRDSTLVATKIKIEDNFPNNDDDEVEFTGVIDSITESEIVVTGVTFIVGDNTIILDDNNRSISLVDLFIGQIVEIRGDRQGDGSLLASHIKVEDDVRGDDEVEFTGNVDSIDSNSLTVSGTTFIVDQNTIVLDNNNNAIDFAMLVVGQLVEVKGFRQGDGSILAVRIKIEDRDDDEVELTGEIESIDGSSIVVAGLTFQVDDRTVILDNDNQPIMLADLSVGLIVEIRADVQPDGSLLASDIKIEDRLEDEVEVRGIVDSVGDSSIVVLGRAFAVVPTTELLDNNNMPIDLSSFAAGSIAELKANLLPGGILIAIRVKLEDNDPLRIRVRGPIDAVGSDTLNVAGIFLLLNNETAVVDQDGNVAMVSDLAAGQSVNVEAQGQTTGLPLATRVEIKKVASVIGSITSIAGDRLVIAGATIGVDGNTTVLGVQNESLSLSILSEGQFAKVHTEISGNLLTATTVELLTGSTRSVAIADEKELPAQFQLNQNYPNPFNPTTTISFDVLGDQYADISLTIYNVLGQSVRTLLVGELSSGHYEVEWNGRDNAGLQLASGLYLYQLRVNQLIQTKSMVLMK